MRLAQFLAHAGLASRRNAEIFITEGRIAVNGIITTELATRVTPGQDKITLDGKPISLAEQYLYLAVHKPSGYLSTTDQFEKRKTVLHLLPKELCQGKRISIVGRLDKESEGLLLITDDGQWANHLMHPRYEKEKTYRVIARGLVSDEAITSLQTGVSILVDDVPYTTLPCKVRCIDRSPEKTTLEFILREGKKRQLRLMCAAIGHPVRYLQRTHIGTLALGDLPLGAYRHLTPSEVSTLWNDDTGQHM